MLVRPDDGGFQLLDEVGAHIWELCDGARSVEQVIADVGVFLDRPPVAVAGEVREWIAELRVERLLVDVEVEVEVEVDSDGRTEGDPPATGSRAADPAREIRRPTRAGSQRPA